MYFSPISILVPITLNISWISPKFPLGLTEEKKGDMEAIFYKWSKCHTKRNINYPSWFLVEPDVSVHSPEDDGHLLSISPCAKQHAKSATCLFFFNCGQIYIPTNFHFVYIFLWHLLYSHCASLTIHLQSSFHLANLKLHTHWIISPLSPALSPGKHRFTVCLYNLTTLRASCNWNHTACVLWWLACCTGHNVLKLPPCYAVCQNDLLY